MKDKMFLQAPALFVLGLVVLTGTWLAMAPEALRAMFDQGGYSPVELATIPFFAAIIPLVWWKCPFTGSRRRRILLCAAVSCVAFMAVSKELDWHLQAIQALWPDVTAAFKGTPFKMRFLTSRFTNGAQALPIPWAAKAFVVAYFALFFGVFAALLVYFARALVCGFFARVAPAWTIAFLGGTGVMVQLCDRMPAWIRHARGLPKSDAVDALSAFFTAFEEGGELLIALFALLAIVQAHRLYGRQ